MSRFVISGAGGGTRNRLEINDFIKDERQFSLYIQALNEMFNESQSDITSHFGISGIHGAPYKQWDGAGDHTAVPGSEWGGYCTHGSVLFPTWHRPYVALYEQVLHSHAVNIAAKYQVDKDAWKTAAEDLRAPFWDWAANILPPPEVISLQTVNIINYDGNTISVTNPLYQYAFHPVDDSFPGIFKVWQTTLRHPNPSDSPNATTDVDRLKEELEANQGDVTSSTYNLLTRVHTWPAFSNHTPGDGGSTSNSLEAIHDRIHFYVGGAGQMGDAAVAGFDPIFYLHHANVDRLLAFWSALNPDVWVTPGPAVKGTWTIPAKATVDANTNLTPFWNTQSTFWASSGTKTTEALNYTYPEFNNLKPGEVQQAIMCYVNDHYGGAEYGPFGSIARHVAQPAPAPVARIGLPVTAAVSAVKSVAEAAIRDWTCRIQFKKHELRQSFAILIFLGSVPDDPAQWRTSPTFVGSHVAFVNSAAERCANCREQADIVCEGFVHLNVVISRRSGFSSFEPNLVTPYLRDALHWRLQAADGSPIPLEELPSLEVTIASTLLSQQPGSIFPILGVPFYHHQITLGRQGGARQAPA